MIVAWGRRFARLTTIAVVRSPLLWRVFRPAMRGMFERLAPRWDTMRAGAHLAAYELALDAIDVPPRRALDIGTGTGDAALAIARRFPEAEVIGVDLAPEMVAQARLKMPRELAGRVRFAVGDSSALEYADEAFDLVSLANMIPFFDEIARLVAPGGRALFSFSLGDETPIYVSFARLREELGRRSFTDFAEFAAGAATALLAHKPASE